MIKKEKKWSKEEIKLLAESYSHIPTKEIMSFLNRSKESVYHKTRRLNLKWVSRKWDDEIDYEKEEINSIVNYGGIINTYPLRERRRAQSFLFAKKLRKMGTKMSEISKKVKTSKSTLLGWSCNKGKPYPLRSIEKLIDLNLIPLREDNTKKFGLFLKLFAYIFTDGSINRKISRIVIGGEFEDLNDFKQEIEEIFPQLKCCISTKKSCGKIGNRTINGISSVLVIRNTALARLLYAAGTPIGDKVIQKLEIPKWIFNLDDELKKIFLGIFWSCEGSKPLKLKTGFNLFFGMAKAEKLMEDHLRFLQQLKQLFKEFDIETSDIKWDKRISLRKDGIISKRAYFYVKSNYKNFLKFYGQIPIFAKKKKECFDNTYLEVLKIKRKMEAREKLRKEILRKATRLLKEGKSKNFVTNKLNVPRSTLRYWLEFDQGS